MQPIIAPVEDLMTEYQRRRTRIWWLSGILAVLGAGIAIFAALEYFITTLVTVGLAVVVTILLGAVLAQADKLR
ncbi:hypothetical protein GCM10023190_12680 [Enteractinococcus fodinae]